MKKIVILAAIASLLMTSMAFAFETKSATDSSYTEMMKKKHKKHKKAKKAAEKPAEAAPAAQ